jgi:hypothetical protein
MNTKRIDHAVKYWIYTERKCPKCKIGYVLEQEIRWPDGFKLWAGKDKCSNCDYQVGG